MNKRTYVRMTIEVPADLTALVMNAAKERGATADSIVSECIAQQFETAIRHRTLIERQNDVDEALLEIARLIGRLSAGPAADPADFCRYKSNTHE